MCCFNRPMPRVVNNCTTVVMPAIPIQAGLNGGAVAGMNAATPTFPEMCAPNNVLDQNQVAAARAAAVAGASVVSGQCQNVCNPQVECIIEPAVVTAPNIINHQRRVEHIVPVITEDIHQHRTLHEFVARPEHRVRQTFDTDVSVGPPLATQQMPLVAPAPVAQPQQLVPLEVDVFERFGVNGNQMGANGMVNQGAVVNPALLGQMSNVAGQTMNGFVR